MQPNTIRSRVTLDEAVELARTGDIWIFRGASTADRAIQALTNAPVNHVGMTVALDDLPPLMWHAELGRSLPDMWTGRHHRGVQLHDLRSAVQVWGARYGQRGWLRQMAHPVTAHQEDQLLRTIARLDGTPFPSTAKLTGRWFAGRLPRRRRAASTDVESAYCAEVVGVTMEEMGLLEQRGRSANWYDPGRFWSGDRLPLAPGVQLGREIEVVLSDTDLDAGREIGGSVESRGA
ncbi:hypothetical protein [Rhodococcus chondri]|uniref:Guanylate cyclase n=1 Tax=Rhodococcus chondri TaxID=3065941 RepID=A0ABU7JU18_9NOCA|nr:hypothetical protein [Rhodococcus sp. CC-R104]MEE2032772.1 hypothetical protein [Rhodococcus sp. CC-R104]